MKNSYKIIIKKFKIADTNFMKKYKPKQVLILIGVGLLGGAINGLFGAGAGLLLVPLIELCAKLEEKKTHATTLACVMLMCIVSSVVFVANKQVDYKLTMWCLIGSMGGAILGTVLLQKFKNKIINLIFSCLLIAAGVLMIVL